MSRTFRKVSHWAKGESAQIAKRGGFSIAKPFGSFDEIWGIKGKRFRKRYLSCQSRRHPDYSKVEIRNSF